MIIQIICNQESFKKVLTLEVTRSLRQFSPTNVLIKNMRVLATIDVKMAILVNELGNDVIAQTQH